DTVVLGWLRIPGLGLGRLPGVGVPARRVSALVEAPGPAQLVLGRVTGVRRVPVGTRVLAQPGTPLGATLRFEQRDEARPQPDTAHQGDPCGHPTLCSLRAQPFSEPQLALERPAGRGEDRPHLLAEGPPGLVQAAAGLAARVHPGTAAP